MTSKICDIETNKELIVPYDCMKPCRSPPGGFVPPANTPHAPMQPPNELRSNSSPAKCHSCFCEAPITCTPSDAVPVSSSVPTIQSAPHTMFASSPVANDNPAEPSAPLEEKKDFQTAHLIPPCVIPFMFLKSLNPQINPSTLLFPPRPFVMTHFLSSTPSFLLPGPFSP